MNKLAKRIVTAFALFASLLLVASPAFAAAPDGLGPWADSVFSSHQGLMKNGQPVPAARSNPTAALGVAENTPTVDSTFFSLGFGGNIVLGFDNGIAGGSMVVESTIEPGYPIETAKVELSADGTNWFMAGNVSQTGTVNQPSGLKCAKFARITDTSIPNNYPDDIADGYDVDGVKALGNPCEPVACMGSCCSDITQTNNTNITTIVSSNANTGKNKVKDNTSGNNSITTGDASNSATINVGGSSNTATTTCCNCGNTSVDISGNGKGSKNIVNINSIKAPTPPSVISLKKVH